ncbi:MAG: hypothetical protein QMC77_05425 [Methanocellales archaeon]|nr:hypothetical protein [Methanocellales archaeon]
MIKLTILAAFITGVGIPILQLSGLLPGADKVHTTSFIGLSFFFILIWLSFRYFKMGRESVK